MNYALSNLDTLQREVSRIAGISDKEQQRASGSRQTNHVVRARARRMLSSLLIPFLINSICDEDHRRWTTHCSRSLVRMQWFALAPHSATIACRHLRYRALILEPTKPRNKAGTGFWAIFFWHFAKWAEIKGSEALGKPCINRMLVTR